MIYVSDLAINIEYAYILCLELACIVSMYSVVARGIYGVGLYKLLGPQMYT